MEAFLTDGLRSVLNTIPAEELSEYTVRWPGHIQMFINETENAEIDLERITAEWQYNKKLPSSHGWKYLPKKRWHQHEVDCPRSW